MFGNLVRAHRQRLGLSQAELATRSGVAERSLRNIEAGRIVKPRPGTVRLLADSLDLAGADRDRFCEAALSQPSAATADEPVDALTGPPVPAQLPADVTGFAGRSGDVRDLDAWLDGTGAAGAVVISAIAGTAGVGKTALAVHWAHRVVHRFPDGQLYVNLRGFDPGGAALSPSDALGGFLQAVGAAPHAIPADLPARAALYRSLLAGKRMLVVLDNARDAEQVRPLLPGAAGCLVLVTSRNQLTSLVAVEGAYPVALDLLTHDEARWLLAGRVGPARAAAEPDAIAEIVVRCARLPLALAVVAARAAVQPRLPLAALAADLRNSGGALDALDGGDAVSNVRAVFSWSYQALRPGAARLFRLLGQHPGADADVYAAASLAEATVAQTRSTLAELTRAHVLIEHVPGRYTFHDLLRAYAAAQVTANERRTAFDRLLHHYLYTAATAMDVMYPAEHSRRPRVSPATSPTPVFADTAAARTWLDAERANLVAVAERAAADGRPECTVRLSATLFRYLDIGGHFDEAAVLYTVAHRAARLAGDRAAEAEALSQQATGFLRRERYEQAAGYYRQALALFGELGDANGQGRMYNNLAGVYLLTGDGEQAAVHLEYSVAAARERGDEFAEAMTLNNLGTAYELLGRYQRAAEQFQRALHICRRLGHRDGQATALNELGAIQRRLGRYGDAVEQHRRALALHHELGHHGPELAHVRNNLGYTYHLMGRQQEAATQLEQALAHARALVDRRGEADALASLGAVYRELGRPKEASEHLEHALDLFREVGNRAGEAHTLNTLGETSLKAGRADRARLHHETALCVAAKTGDRYEQARAHRGLARASYADGNVDGAARHWRIAMDLYTELDVPQADEIRHELTDLDRL